MHTNHVRLEGFDGEERFRVALLGERMLHTRDFTHWAVGFFNLRRNVVVHWRNEPAAGNDGARNRLILPCRARCQSDSRSESAEYVNEGLGAQIGGDEREAVRITSWNAEQLQQYMGIMGANSVRLSLRDLEAKARQSLLMNAVGDCQEFAIKLLVEMGVTTEKSELQALKNKGEEALVQLEDKMTKYTPFKWLLPVIGWYFLAATYDDWEQCNRYFENWVTEMRPGWQIYDENNHAEEPPPVRIPDRRSARRSSRHGHSARGGSSIGDMTARTDFSACSPRASQLEATEPSPLRREGTPATPRLKVSRCVVCMDLPATHALVPCGHRCLCASHAVNVPRCPVCRGAVERMIRVFDVT